eukprot:8189768-Lingulodinium_polyedra.AAC.1
MVKRVWPGGGRGSARQGRIFGQVYISDVGQSVQGLFLRCGQPAGVGSRRACRGPGIRKNYASIGCAANGVFSARGGDSIFMTCENKNDSTFG